MQTQPNTRQPLPRINNRPVTEHGAEAHYRRLRTDPRHPDASYTIPDRSDRRWCIDVILFLLAIAIVAAIVL